MQAQTRTIGLQAGEHVRHNDKWKPHELKTANKPSYIYKLTRQTETQLFTLNLPHPDRLDRTISCHVGPLPNDEKDFLTFYKACKSGELPPEFACLTNRLTGIKIFSTDRLPIADCLCDFLISHKNDTTQTPTPSKPPKCEHTWTPLCPEDSLKSPSLSILSSAPDWLSDPATMRLLSYDIEYDTAEDPRNILLLSLIVGTQDAVLPFCDPEISVTSHDINTLAASGQYGADITNYLTSFLVPNITKDTLDTLIEKHAKRLS